MPNNHSFKIGDRVKVKHTFKRPYPGVVKYVYQRQASVQLLEWAGPGWHQGDTVRVPVKELRAE